MNRKSLQAFEIIGIAVILLSIVIFLVVAGPFLGLVDPTIAIDFTLLLPGLLVFGVGITVVFIVRGLMSIPANIFTGIVLAILLGTMYNPPLSLVTAPMLSGLTLIQLQIWVIVFFTMVGSLIAAATRKS